MTDSTESPDLSRRGGLTRLKEGTYGGLFAACAAITLLTTAAIFVTLLSDAVVFFRSISVAEFLTGTNWSPNPAGGGQAFGIIPLLIGTITVTITAAFISIPIGTLTAIYLSEYATPNARSILKPLLEILAGIPTVVYGYFALVYVTPALKATLFPEMSTFNALSASIMVGIMTIPMVSSISEDAMSAVPDELRQAGYGLGATKFEVSTGIVVPASISGIASSYILAVSRAIGETMIVVVAMGAQARMPAVREALFGIPFVNPADVLLESGMTITVAMVQITGGDLTGGTLPYNSMFALGLALFAVTLVMNVISDIIAQRYREEY
ncbi:phosphate ABC transporter permease subunit PstC [Halorubrum ezzemoulense]|uniref:Phosphate transport system permease protein n=2 Tax=Halorubrum ezzemoulense TaxID=337243 RepID=A0A1X4H928_HALEZ|nr:MULTISPECIES: phosphate ABC transporter permease subunit PstC [Halorubrum]MDB2245026.1 phosphate ABC transporter permease subunit PstC [Halorubrum ezzemoulense]MDB2252512.1 phosphate ABC transporter permease subunit PstC [Halorubrum ezzemoulense]MDB2278216.1 phosphate ABC transporter permease subunit PstC [Halorubrum ezzemoulense]MDB2284890.1 phosphate ABC transporter permease subunit PstC [Halorubrum ezzemoulense]MDB2288362.1 phosphate ABC transporter permease subunit PstC [Halorubrum ezze